MSALGSVPLQASWMLQDSPAALKEIISFLKKEHFLCIVVGFLFCSLTSLRNYHYSPVPFHCFEACISFSFQAECPCFLLLGLVLLLQTCVSSLNRITLFSVHGLVLFLFLGWYLVLLWYLALSLRLSPSFCFPSVYHRILF